MAVTPNNKPYENYVLANEVEDQFKSHIDHARFCTVDETLEGVPGMKKTVRKYFAKTTTPGTEATETEEATDPTSDKDGQPTEVLNLKQGNSKFIEMDYEDDNYVIKLAQNTGIWYDEEQMKDPYVGLVIARHAGTSLFNKTNDDIVAELNKTQQTAQVASGDYFSAFVDAQALLPSSDESDTPGSDAFALVNKFDVARIRKSLKDELKYVEAFARRGYIGTVAGTNIYVDPLMTATKQTAGTIILATKQAVTLFVKTGTQVEDYQRGNRSSADADIRKNTIISRKYYLAALTDGRYAVKITV